mmetsp:Transcript_71948/g.159219  ORF Transcript_71948/g.159219 Transcript_71948/m.159219 type:complete len:310 (+) Transcript_71948:1120-2049(+)
MPQSRFNNNPAVSVRGGFAVLAPPGAPPLAGAPFTFTAGPPASFWQRQRITTGALTPGASRGCPSSPKHKRLEGQTARGKARTSPQAGSTRAAAASPRSKCRTQSRCRSKPSSFSAGKPRKSSSSATLAHEAHCSPVASVVCAELPSCRVAFEALMRASRAQKSSPRNAAAKAESRQATRKSMPTMARRPPVAPAAPKSPAASRRSSRQHASSTSPSPVNASAACVAMRPKRRSPMVATAGSAQRPRIPRTSKASHARKLFRACALSMSRVTPFACSVFSQCACRVNCAIQPGSASASSSLSLQTHSRS